MMPRHACEAKTRRGTPCQRAAMPNGRCYRHGGASLGGLASPSLTTGRYSKYLPTRLLARYQEAQADGELLALRDELALLDARLADLLQRVDTGESGALWRALHAQLEAFQRAQATGDVPAMKEHLGALQQLITQGATDYAAWADVRSVIEQRRRLVESERKRLIDLQQMLSAEQALLLVTVLTESVRRHVHDRSALAAISADLARYLSHPYGGDPGR